MQERINSMLYERTAIIKKPEITSQNELKLLKSNQQISPDLIFKDPYFLDFLGLKEKDKCLGLLYIGYPAIEWPSAHRKPLEYTSEWITQ